MSIRTSMIAFAVLARAVSAEASHIIPTGLVLDGNFPTQVTVEWTAFDPPPFMLGMDGLSWTLTATGNAIITTWEPGPRVEIPVRLYVGGPLLGFSFTTDSVSGLGEPGAVITGHYSGDGNYGVGLPEYAPNIPLGTLTLLGQPGEVVFDGLLHQAGVLQV